MEKPMTKHTPGPWYYTGSSPDGSVYSKDHELIVPWSPLLSDRKMANAKLISKAPEMLTLLARLERVLSRDETDPDPLKYADIKRGTYAIADKARAILNDLED